MNRLDLADPVARAITTALGIGVLEAACLAVLVLAIARLSRPSATTRHVLWWIALAAGATLPVVSIATSLGRIEHRPAVNAHVAQPPAVRSALQNDSSNEGRAPDATTARVWTPAEIAAAGGAGTDQSVPAGFVQMFALARNATAFVLGVPHLAAGLVVLWLAGALIGLAQVARGMLSLAAIKRAALPLDETVVRRLRRWRHSTKLGREVSLRVSNDVDVPVAVGFRTPTILLPARVVETEEIADLDQIAMHEYAHLNRYDDWTNLVQRLVERIFWFNPVVLLVGRRISLEREIACDDWVVAQTGRAHRYATCLWKLVESARLPANAILAPGALLTPKQITTRIEKLLDSRRNALPRLSPLGAIALGSFGVALIVLQAQRAPVIAIEDLPAIVVAAPAIAAKPILKAASPTTKPVAAPHVAAPLPAPAIAAVPPAPPANAAPRADDPSPAAIATALAAALSARDRATVKAAVENTNLRVVESVEATVRRATQREATEHRPATEAKARAQAEVAAVGPIAGAAAGAGAALGVSIARTVVASVTKGIVADLPFDDSEPATLTRETVARCFGCDLRNRDLRGIDLHGIALNGADLRNADLRGVDLSGAKLFGVDLRNAKLDGADLRGAAVSGCDLRGATLTNANLDGLKLTGTSVRGVTLGGNRLRSLVDGCMGCDLRGLDLHGQDLHEIKLSGADLRGADLHDANLSGAHLVGVDMRDARVDGADLTNAELSGCDLRGVDLNSAKTRGLSTAYAELRGLDARLSHLHDRLSHLHDTLQRVADRLTVQRNCTHRAMAP